MNKKQKNIITLILISALLVIIIVNHFYKRSVSADYFAIKDISEITLITLYDQHDSIVIEKKEDKWIINNQWNVKKKALQSFINTVKRLEIKSLLSDETAKRHIQKIQSEGIYVKIYKANILLQSYIFYEDYTNEINSFLLDQSKEKLYLMKIPGYYGKLSNYINTDNQYWRENLLIHLEPFEINSVKVNYINNPEESYTVLCDTLSRYFLYNIRNQMLYCIPKNIEKYFTYFQNILYEKEYLENDLNSIDTSHHYASLCLTHINSNMMIFDFYKIPLHKNNNSGDYDLNYALVRKHNYDHFYKVKYIEIDLLLKDIQYFK